MTNRSIFRKDVINARAPAGLTRPGPTAVLPPWVGPSVAAFALLIATTCMIFGSHTRRVTARGIVEQKDPAIDVTSPVSGLLSNVFVKEGGSVDKNIVLVNITQPYIGLDIDAKQRSDKLGASMEASLAKQIVSETAVLSEQEKQLEGEFHLAKLMSANVALRAEVQTRVIRSGEKLLAKFEPLVAKGYVSEFQIEERRADLLKERLNFLDLTRQRISADQAALEVAQKIARLRHVSGSAIEALRREATAKVLANFESTSPRSTSIRSETSGRVDVISVSAGTRIEQGQFLMRIVPSGNEFVAVLEVGEAAAVLIKPGAKVALRYHAYPYTRFGTHHGTVLRISESGLPRHRSLGQAGPNTEERMRRVQVTIPSDAPSGTSSQMHLATGMLVDAEVFVERRSFLEMLIGRRA